MCETTAKRDWWDKEFQILTVFGDSITAGGWASTRDRCWANLLTDMINDCQRVPVQLINVGVGANVVSPKSQAYLYSNRPSAIERTERHVLHYTANGACLQPDLLVIAFSVNDARGGTTVEIFCEEMKKMIHMIRQEIQPLIVLVGPTYICGWDWHGKDWAYADLDVFRQYNEALCKLSEELDCLFVDILNEFQEAPWLVHHDGVHLNDTGHRLYANKVFNVLLANCSGLSAETRTLEDQIAPWRDESVLDEKAPDSVDESC